MSDASTTATTAAATTAATAAAATAAATTTAAPWYQGKADQETIGHWDNKGWKKDDPAEIAIQATKAARELQKHFGVPETQLIKLPKDATDEAGWKSVYSRLGAPDDAKGYDMTTVKHADGRDLDTGLADSLREAMYGAHVAKDRAADIIKAVVKHVDNTAAEAATQKAATLKTERDALNKDWGTNFEFNKLTAMQGVKRLGIDPATVATLESAVGYSKVMEMFRKIGAGTSEDTFHGGGQGGAPTTAAGAKARLAELQADVAWAKALTSTAGGAKEKAEFANLMQQIHGAG